MSDRRSRSRPRLRLVWDKKFSPEFAASCERAYAILIRARDLGIKFHIDNEQRQLVVISPNRDPEAEQAVERDIEANLLTCAKMIAVISEKKHGRTQ